MYELCNHPQLFPPQVRLQAQVLFYLSSSQGRTSWRRRSFEAVRLFPSPKQVVRDPELGCMAFSFPLTDFDFSAEMCPRVLVHFFPPVPPSVEIHELTFPLPAMGKDCL